MNEERYNSPILLVDDDIALLQALPQVVDLRMKNVHVETCASAHDALELIKEHDYDAIVSDIKMPEMDGIELLSHVREIRISYSSTAHHRAWRSWISNPGHTRRSL